MSMVTVVTRIHFTMHAIGCEVPFPWSILRSNGSPKPDWRKWKCFPIKEIGLLANQLPVAKDPSCFMLLLPLPLPAHFIDLACSFFFFLMLPQIAKLSTKNGGVW